MNVNYVYPEENMGKSKKGSKLKVLWPFLLLIAFIYLNNSSSLTGPGQEKPLFLAHRGLAQNYSMEGMTAETSTARRIYPPEHPYLENTIPSMEAAFRAGADMVEFDIHPTRDGQFAVFHDWIIDYRTNGKGVTRDYTMAELKRLDVGYGYTADEGKTYPFRGKGVGLMPSLAVVLTHFPDRPFLIHIKSNDPQEGVLLAEYLRKFPPERLGQLAVYGGDRPIATLKQKIPALRVMSIATTKRAILAYMAVGWTGHMPAAMRHEFFYLPLRYARLLWGWPHRFIQRIQAADSYFFVVAGNGKWSEGFDTVEALKQLPPGYHGGIWTDRIDRIAPVYKKGGNSF
jgi:glycerophosphoryl diester phosphodiesterase